MESRVSLYFLHNLIPILAKIVFYNRETTMLAMLELLETQYGGVEGYLKNQCTFSDHDIERIKENLRMTPDTQAMSIPE